MTLRDRITAALDGTGLCADSAEDRERIASLVAVALARMPSTRPSGKLREVKLYLTDEIVDALDRVAGGLQSTRSEVARWYLMEPLQSRCLLPLSPPSAHPAGPDDEQAVSATSAADASSSEQGATSIARAPSARRKHKRHLWDERVDFTREEPSLRSKHGAGR